MPFIRHRIFRRCVIQKTGSYKKCIVDARAHERTDGQGWSAEVSVAQDIGDSTIDTPFFLKQTFGTAEEAISAAIGVAKQKIDEGIVPTSIVEQPSLG